MQYRAIKHEGIKVTYRGVDITDNSLCFCDNCTENIRNKIDKELACKDAFEKLWEDRLHSKEGCSESYIARTKDISYIWFRRGWEESKGGIE